MRLGEILVAANACDEAAIAKALEHSRFSDSRLGSSLIELGLVGSDIIAAALGKQHGIAPAKEANFKAIEPATLALLSGTDAHARKALPLGIQRTTGELAVAMRDPDDQGSIDALKKATGKEIIVAAASEHRIRQGLLEHYGAPDSLPIIPEEEPLDLELAAPPKLEERAHVPLVADTPPPPQPLPEARVATPEPKFDLRAFLGTGRGMVIAGVAFIAFLVIGKFAYDWIIGKDIPVAGSFEADHVNLKLTVPKTGWVYAPSADVEESQGPVSVRIAMLYRGDNIKKPDDALWLMRVTGPIPTSISESQFDTLIRELNQTGASRMVFTGFQAQEFSCDRSSRRSGLTTECVGNGDYKGKNYQLSAFLWQEQDGSIVAVLFLTQGEFTSFDDEIDSILSSIRLL